MFAINLTHRQVTDIVGWLVEAERREDDNNATTRAYFEGQTVAYLDILRMFYSTKEIKEMKNDVIHSEKGGVTNDED